jgi:hypothetical protein
MPKGQCVSRVALVSVCLVSSMCIHELDLTRWVFFTFQHFLLEQIDSNDQLRVLRDLPSDLADVSAAAKVSIVTPRRCSCAWTPRQWAALCVTT